MSTGTSAPRFPNYPPSFPGGMGPSFPYPNGPTTGPIGGPTSGWPGTIVGGNTQPPPNYEDFDFSSLDLPQWGGAYSAPLLSSQIDSMRGFDQLARQSPLAQTMNNLFRFGGDVQDLGNSFRPYGTGYGTLENMATSQPGNVPQIPGSENIQQAISGFMNGSRTPTGDYGAPMATYGQIMGGQGGDFGSLTQQLIGQLNGTQIPGTQMSGALGQIDRASNLANTQADVSGVTNFINNTLGNSDVSNRTGSNQFLNSLFSGGGVDPATAGLTSQLTSQLGNSFNASYDLDPYFQNARNVFNSDLDQQLARVREEQSGLGLGPGMSDRMDALGRTAGDATAKFNLGMQDVARQSFNEAEARRLGAISTGSNLAGLTQLGTNNQMSMLPALMQNEGAGFSESLAQRGQQLGALPTMLQALGMNPELAQRAAGLQIQGAGTYGQLAQVPFQEMMAGINNRYGSLSSLLGSEQLGLSGQDANTQNRLRAAGQMGDTISRGVGEQQFGSQLAASILPMMMQANNLPFEQQMQLYSTILNPAADRRLNAGSQLLGADQNALQTGLGAMGLQGNMFQQNYNMGEQARGAGDQELMRMISEFQRTQGGALNQALGVMGIVPNMNTGFGPSPMSQWASGLAGLGGLATAGVGLYNALR